MSIKRFSDCGVQRAYPNVVEDPNGPLCLYSNLEELQKQLETLEEMLTKLGIEFETKPRQEGDLTQADLDRINEEMWEFSKQNNYNKMKAWVDCHDFIL